MVTKVEKSRPQRHQLIRSRGSHRHFKHPDEAFVITVPGNDGKELAPGTLNVILKKAGLK